MLTVTYIGGPTALIEAGGWRILTDPTFDPPGRRYFFGWGTASRKLAGPALDFASLGSVDAVLLSHDHHDDNLDPTGRSLLERMGRIFTTRAGARRLGGRAEGLADWETVALAGPGRATIEITATPCRHGPPGSRPIVGDVIGFALRWPEQRHGALWVSGDSVLYPGLREVAARVTVGTAMLNLGGVTFPWLSGPLRYTMNAEEAVELSQLLDPHVILPLHYEGWKHFRQSRGTAQRILAASPVADRVRWLAPGMPTVLEA